jgi:hypothetical protein
MVCTWYQEPRYRERRRGDEEEEKEERSDLEKH